VWNTVKLTATATDDQGIDKIEIKIDNVSVGTAPTSPYEFSWDTQTIADGQHKATAIATDKAGNQKTAEFTVVVQNTLISSKVDSDILALNDGYQMRGFIFLSDADGKLLVAQEYHNNDPIALKAPAYNGNDFIVTEAMTLHSDNDIFLLSTQHVTRGTWVMTAPRYPAENQPAGTADLTFNNLDANSLYHIVTNGDWADDISKGKLQTSLSMSVIPSQLYVSSYNVNTGVTNYNLFTNIKAGTNTPIDLALITKAVTEETITLPKNLNHGNINTWGLASADTQNDAYFLFSIGSSGTWTYKYPGNAFPAYYSDSHFWGEDYDAENYSKKPYDFVPLNATLNLSLDNGKLAVAATGTMDVYYIDVYRSDASYWTFVTSQPTATITVPEIPVILKDLVNTDLSTATQITLQATDYAQLSGYTGFIDFLRSSTDGLPDLSKPRFLNEKNLTRTLSLNPEGGGRQSSSPKKIFFRPRPSVAKN